MSDIIDEAVHDGLIPEQIRVAVEDVSVQDQPLASTITSRISPFGDHCC